MSGFFLFQPFRDGMHLYKKQLFKNYIYEEFLISIRI